MGQVENIDYDVNVQVGDERSVCLVCPFLLSCVPNAFSTVHPFVCGCKCARSVFGLTCAVRSH
jgi:hypothetical protein